jgi:2-polyprenyl-3-methyl-5-hydroxy-6-metoxy-1,4-benzoquinol methylase
MGEMTDNFDQQYAEKPVEYFGAARLDFVERLTDAPDAAVLELGCGGGATGALALARGKCARYVGIELDPRAAQNARGCLTQVLEGNVERMTLDFPPASFDALIMSEVLEHLVDPWAVVKELAIFLKPGAKVMASVPNVAHRRVIAGLIKGHFELTDFGIMDRTHLRWFTPKSFTALFEQAGLTVDDCAPISQPSFKTKLFHRVTGGRFRHLTMSQINLFAHKPG